MTENKLVFKVGSRKSKLALIQTNLVIDELQKHYPDFKFKIVEMATTGDKILDIALSKIGEKSLFTKELEVALANEEVDFVVHSLKDLPTVLPPGMTIGAIGKREDPRDGVVFRSNSDDCSLEKLPKGSVIGTSSLRRRAQLKRLHPHLNFQDVRGNLNTRLSKLSDPLGPYSALVLASAGLSRLGLSSKIGQYLNTLHAVGQGALAVECREGDCRTSRVVASVCHRESALACLAERAFMRRLEGGCSVPIGVSSDIDSEGNRITLKGGVWSLDGNQLIEKEITRDLPSEDGMETDEEEKEPKTKKIKTDDAATSISLHITGNFLSKRKVKAAEKVGEDLAQLMLDDGADEILTMIKAYATVKNGNSSLPRPSANHTISIPS